jgi:hypothetical protein
MLLFMLFTSKIEKPGHVIQRGENQEITGTEQRTTIHSLVTRHSQASGAKTQLFQQFYMKCKGE